MNMLMKRCMARMLLAAMTLGVIPLPSGTALAADTQPPSAPANVESVWRTPTSVHLTWSVPADDTGVTGYDIYRDGTLAGSVTGAPDFTADGLTAGTVYAFTVKAKDAAGNVSAASGPLSVNLEEMDRALWTVSASHNNAGGAPGLAIDASASTRWGSGTNQTAGMWFQLDTGPGPKSYSKLVIDSTSYSGDYARGYEVTVSDDGQAWSAPVAQGNGGVLINAEFATQTARYVRITLTKSVGNWWSIQNIKLIGSRQDDTAPPSTPASLAAAGVTDSDAKLEWSASTDDIAVLGYELYNGAAYAGFTRGTSWPLAGLMPNTGYSYAVRAVDYAGKRSDLSAPTAFKTRSALDRTLWAASASAGSASAASATDGSGSTRWTSGAAQTVGMWFQIDTGPGGKSFNKLVMSAAGSNGDYAREFDITVSDDGAAWSTPIARVTGTSATIAAIFPDQTKRFVRFTLTKASGSWWSIHELNLYGAYDPDTNPPTAPANPVVSKLLDTQFDVSWDASADDVAVVGYNLYLDTALIGYTTSRTFRFTQLTPDTDYSLVIKAKDLYGNESAGSLPTIVRTKPLIHVPLIAKYEMEPVAGDPAGLYDSSNPSSPAKAGATASATAFVDGRTGQGKALYINGPDQASITSPGSLNRVSSALTVTAWIKPDDLNGYLPIVSKRDANWKGTTFFVSLQAGKLYFGADYGEKWYNWSFASPDLAAGQWAHIAVAFEKYEGVRFYVNGKLIGQAPGSAVFTDLLPNDVAMLIGTEWHYDSAARAMIKDNFRGAIDSLRMYAAPLTGPQINADMNNTIATRIATADDFTAPTKYSLFRLVRFDTPTGLATKGNAKIHQTAARVGGPNAVDWPDITMTIPLNRDGSLTRSVKPFANGAEYRTETMLHQSPDNMPVMQQPYDNVFQPGNHAVRGLYWRWGQSVLYTTDRTARSWMWDYELWTFPVKIEGASPGTVKNVVLTNDGKQIYNSGTNVYDSLTLLLPQNEDGKPYELTVDGRGPVVFQAGLQPVVPGEPKDVPIVFSSAVPGAGPAITVRSVDRPETFPHTAAWNADAQALSGAKPASPAYADGSASIARHVGIEAPRSPETVHFVYLPHGMSSGGFFHSEHKDIAAMYQDIGTAQEYADYVADTGYDRVYEFSSFTDAAGAKSHENVAIALANRGVQLGLVPRTDWDVISPASQNLPFYASYNADFHAPLYRDIQLGLQRLVRYPNIAGISLGADNASYAQYWDWAPPHPNRPWGLAYRQFQQAAGLPAANPVAPSLLGGYSLKKHEYAATAAKPFLDYIGRYNETYKEYGYFAQAAQEVNAGYTTTTGSFGSSPGVGGRGGWLWATIPGKAMHQQLPVQTAYDWNELGSSKPLHTVSLVDRLKSDYPNKPTSAIQDDFSLFFGKMDREKAYALTLTRGVQSIGTNVLANNKGALARPQTIAEQKELYAWIHKYGGAYAMTEPTPPIGIVFVAEQALLRNIVGGDNPSGAQLLQGSHEGKVNEALFMAHAAGWPAKIVTPEELKRGLPSSIHTLLLVGLNTFDGSWHWYDGLVPELQSFVDRGGRIVRDDESESPVASTATGMQIRSYVIQSGTDQTNALLQRNADNMAKLQAAMTGMQPPAAQSAGSTIWAVPTRAGDTQYVTVVNQRHDTAAGRTQRLLGQSGALQWNTDRPIYDVRLGRKLTAAEAAQVDLTANGFQYYALPPAEVTVPELTISETGDGWYEAFAAIRSPQPMAGIPVELTVTHTVSGDTATVYSATGLTAKLPLSDRDAPGTYTVQVKELLSGLTATASVTVAPAGASASSAVAIQREADVRLFAQRTERPLTIALTAAQQADPATVAQAGRLAAYYESQGRTVSLGLAEPGGVVRSLQEYQSLTKYPQWKTDDTDLVLLGTASNNVLLLDLARGYLLPESGAGLAAGHAAVSLANSPFVGEYHALSIVYGDAAGLAAAVDALLGLPASPPLAPRLAGVTKLEDAAVELSWSAPAGGSEPLGYRIERRSGGNAAWQPIASLSVGSAVYRDAGLQPNTFYTYRIQAYNAAGDSPATEPIFATTRKAATPPDTVPPSVPGSLTVAAKTDTVVVLSWGASTDNVGVTGYDIFRDTVKLNGSPIPGTSYQAQGLTPATVYSFSVKAVDAAGNRSAAKGPVSVQTAVYDTPAPGALIRTGWTATASNSAARALNALDGSMSTRWDTATAQVYGQYVQIDMQTVRTFSKLTLDAGGSTYDYPRKYAVYVSSDGVDWGTPVAQGSGNTLTNIVLPSAQTARYIRVVQTSNVGSYWSIHELNVFP